MSLVIRMTTPLVYSEWLYHVFITVCRSLLQCQARSCLPTQVKLQYNNSRNSGFVLHVARTIVCTCMLVRQLVIDYTIILDMFTCACIISSAAWLFAV